MSDLQQHSDDLLSQCGRHCCICHRFRPIRLQVHHILPVSEDGTDDPDNLIALCQTCHSDVHTKVPFTRRFTTQELKQHRDQVIKLVSNGKLVPIEDEKLDFDGIATPYASDVDELSLTSVAIEVLTTAAEDDNGTVLFLRHCDGWSLQAGRKILMEGRNAGKAAEYEDAIEELEDANLIKPRGIEGNYWAVTHQGYLLANEVLTTLKV